MPTPPLLLALSLAALGADDPAEFFEARVRPVLAEHCVSCHGPDKSKSGLRLDTADGLRKGGDGGPVVVPGDPDASPLIEAIRREGPIAMPPKRALPDRAVADLTEWVKRGAPWPDSPRADPADEAWRRHWAFRPVADPPPPAVKDASWPETSIDRFVLARLEAAGLSPSPTADRRTLIRRATFDLLGLPPTPVEVEAFLNDERPDAYARLIDRLLASPRYGERWGRYWLDVARYADTKGYVFFEDAEFPWSYTYRDYVIRARNDDLPYDRFIVEQLAADRLPLGDDKRPLTALGFLTLGARFMNNAHDILDDRIDVTTRGLMGLTVSCARCHDHKFDPIPTADYYALYGVFASSAEPEVPPLFEPPPRTDAYARFADELARREKALDAFLRGAFEEVVRGSRRRAAEYLLAAQAALDKPEIDDFMLLADGGDLNPKMLVRWKTYLGRTRKPHHPVFAPWHALAALPADDFAAGAADLIARWNSDPDPSKPINAIIARALADSPPRSLAEAARIFADLINRADALWLDYSLRSALNGTPAAALPDPAFEELRQVLQGPDAPPNVARAEFNNLDLLPDRPAQAKLQELTKAVETWRAHGEGAPPRAMALADLPTPVEPRVFRRGNPSNPGEVVPRRFLRALAGENAPPFRNGSGRLDLARAIASADNPLTARVLVNRVWMHHFGAPLVATPGDFGMRSEQPTHPELLDHLAKALMQGGWSLKALHRRIMLSAAYQQVSEDRPDGRRIDPENRLLWRMNRRRLDFEATRDALLAASGRLDPTIGGPPVKDMMAPGASRRTLYGFLDRLNLPNLYRSFDFPDPNATSPRRDQTTVAPQALFLMNHPLVLESARTLLRRPEVAGESDPAGKVDRLYRLLYGRSPTGEEARLAREYLADPSGSWERLAQALLISNEFVFVD